MLEAIEKGDDEWLEKNRGIRLTSAWFREHFSLAPNKNVLPKLELPIHIFSGEYDAMTPQKYAKDIEKNFHAMGKTNLSVHYFENHDHDLNYTDFLLTGKISEGIKCVLETAEKA